MANDPLHSWFESLWADREERLYPRFFGKLNEEFATIPPAAFAALGISDPDPRFLTHGVFESPPNERRSHWLYVSSGMSNPWGQTPETVNPADYSGLGYEFTLHTPAQSPWAVKVLQWVMAIQLAIASGRMEGELLQPNDRIDLGNPLPVVSPGLPSRPGELTHLLVATPDAMPLLSPQEMSPHAPAYPAHFSLASGRIDLLLLIGITSREADFARTQGAEALLTLLHHHQLYPITDPARISAL